MKRKQAEALVNWLLDSAAGIDYGQITLTITRHDGQVRFIEKTCMEKEQVPHVKGAADA